MAGPTCGKTTLIAKMNRGGIAVTDTDVITEQLMPEFFRLKVWNMTGGVPKLIEKMRDIIVADEILRTQPKLVLTNLWSKTFMDRLFSPIKGGKPASIYVFRASALEMTQLSKQRGSALSTGLTSKWANSAERWAPTVFDHVLWLPEGVFLSDVITVRSSEWSLTDLGKKLLLMNRTQALSFKFKIQDEKGGSHDK